MQTKTQRARWPLRKGNQSHHPPPNTLSPALSLPLPTPVLIWPEGLSQNEIPQQNLPRVQRRPAVPFSPGADLAGRNLPRLSRASQIQEDLWELLWARVRCNDDLNPSAGSCEIATPAVTATPGTDCLGAQGAKSTSRGSESEGFTWQNPSQELGQVTASQCFLHILR